MIGYQVINCLISQPKHMLGILKRAVAMKSLALSLSNTSPAFLIDQNIFLPDIS